MLRDPLRFALHYAERGWFVVPLCWPHLGRCACGRGYGHQGREGKVPLFRDYMEERMTPRSIRRFWARKELANIGVLLEPSDLLVVDLDGEAAVEEGVTRGLPETLTAKTAKGYHYYYRRPQGVPARRVTNFGESGKIDILSKGFVVAPPSLHRRGEMYQWERFTQTLADPPEWALPLPGWLTPGGDVKKVVLAKRYDEPIRESTLRDALGYLQPEDYSLWLYVGFALKSWEEQEHAIGKGFRLWEEWSQRSPKFPGVDVLNTKWRSFQRDLVTLGTLFKYAREAGWMGDIRDRPLFKSTWKSRLKNL